MSDTGPYSPRPRAAPRRTGRRTSISIIVVVLVAIALAAILTYCVAHGSGAATGAGGRGARGGGGSGGGRPAITVGVARVVAGDIPIQVNALGTVTPLATISVNARVSGLLESVGFKEGQIVRKGQTLAQIDPRPFQAALDQAGGQLARDQALLANAKLDLARYRTLHGQDSIAGQTYDTQVALVRQDEAAVESDRAAAQSARLSLSFTRVTAPVSGRVGLRQIDPGNQVTSNESTPFAVITQMDPITVIFSVPEDEIGPIERQGGRGLATTALDRAGGVVLAQGSLATLDNLIDTTTGTVKARAMFRNAGSKLFPNQFVNVTLLVDTLKNQAIVPSTSVRHGPRGDFVWVLRADRTVESRLVKVGPGAAETVSIAAGLNLGETVITDGGDRLKEGAKVVLPGQSPGGGGGRSSGGRHHRGAGGAGHGWNGSRGGQGGGTG